MTRRVEFTVPVKTRNPLNQSWGHWSAQSKKRSLERAAVLSAMPRMNLAPVFMVTLTRVSRGTLDDDGLRAALKSIRDAVAGRLGVDDGGPLVMWLYLQEKGEPCVRVTVEVLR